MKLTVKNYRALQGGEIDIAHIALVCAPNASGKTSLAQAVASACLGTSAVLEGVKVSETSALIHSGAPKAEIELTGDGGIGAIMIPGRYQSKGERPPRASKYALGLQSVLWMDAKERAAKLLEYLKAEPSKEDLAAALPHVPEKMIDVLWESIAKNGWDASHARAKETGAKLKGQWESRTGEDYGSRKSENWVPEGWSAELAAESADTLVQAVATAKSILETALVEGALSDDERSRLEELSAQLPDAAKAVSDQHAKVESIKAEIVEHNSEIVSLRTAATDQQARQAKRTQLEGLIASLLDLEGQRAAKQAELATLEETLSASREALAALPKPEQAAATKTKAGVTGDCPWCQEPISITGFVIAKGVKVDAKGAAAAEQARKARAAAIEKQQTVVGANQRACNDAQHALGGLAALLEAEPEARAKLAALPNDAPVDVSGLLQMETVLAQLRESLNAANQSLGSCETTLANVTEARNKLAKAPAAAATEEEVNRRREDLADADKRLEAFKLKTEADRIAVNVAINQEMVAALAPTGTRQNKLTERLDGFNGLLKTISEAAGWKSVVVNKDLSTDYGTWPYHFLSESEQYRLAAILQVAMAQLDGSDLLVFDRADILDSDGRRGLLKMLHSLNKRALILMTERMDRVPDLSAPGLGMGISYWIEKGVIHRLGEAAQAAA